MNPDQAVLIAAVISTLVSYIDPVIDAPVFWLAVQVLLAVLVLAVLAVLIAWATEAAEAAKRGRR